MTDIIIQKRGPLQRLGAAATAAYSAFFGPGQPLDAQAPEGTRPRQFDYQPYVNLTYTPRATELISFEQLRALADAYWLIRTLIETRKDQLTKITWHLRRKPKVGESAFDSQKRSEADPAVRRLTEFFNRPDGVNSWQTWLRMILEDMLVIDAPTILPWRNRGGDIFKLVPVDGATIKPVLDPMGMTPPSDQIAYQQVIRGLIASQLTTKDLVYMPRNRRTNKIYGFSPVEQLIMIVNLGLRRQLSQLYDYTEGTVPEAVAQVPDTWSPDQLKQFQTWFDSALSGNLAARRRITFIPALTGGANSLQWKRDAALTDETEEWLARAACFCFSVPPTPFVKQNNRATAQQANDTALREGQEPTKNSVKDLIDLLIQHPDYFGEPKIEFAWDDDVSIDKLKQAQVDQIYISIGKSSVDELRERDGQEKIGVGPGVITKMGFIPFKDGSAVMQMTPMGGGTSDNSPANEGGKQAGDDKNKPAKATTKLQKDAASKKKLTIKTETLPAKATKRQKALAGMLTRFLKKQGKQVAHATAEAYSQVQKDDSDDIDRILRDLELDWSALESTVEGSIGDTSSEAGKSTLTDLSVTDTDLFDLVNKDALEYASKRAAELVGMKFVDGQLVENPDARWAITETTRDELRQIITKAFEEGQTPAELERSIEDSFQFSGNRAEMIARTEMAAAHVQGSLAAAERSGVAVRKFAMLSADHDKDDECDENEQAGEIALDEDFPSGDDGPPFHPGCNCALGIWYESEAVTADAD